MIDDLRRVLEAVSDPADLAVVLLFGTSGFLIDAGLNTVGFLEPGYVGVSAASGALGVKKAIEVGLAKRRGRKREYRERQTETQRATALMHLLQEKEHDELVLQLQRDLELFEAQVVDVDAFRESFSEIVKAYRLLLKSPADLR